LDTGGIGSLNKVAMTGKRDESVSPTRRMPHAGPRERAPRRESPVKAAASKKGQHRSVSRSRKEDNLLAVTGDALVAARRWPQADR